MSVTYTLLKKESMISPTFKFEESEQYELYGIIEWRISIFPLLPIYSE